jgi:integrase
MSRDVLPPPSNDAPPIVAPDARPAFQARGRTVRSQPRDPVTGRRRSITARDPAELSARKRVLEDLRRDVLYGVKSRQEATRIVTAVVEGRITVADVWRKYAESGPVRSRKLLASTWTHRLEPTFGDRVAWELDEGTMRQWEADQLRLGMRPKTVKNAYDLLAAAYNLAVRSKRITELPWGGWRPTKDKGDQTREAARSLEEFASLVRAAQIRDAGNWRAGVFSDLTYRVLVMGLCGLRQGEAAGLAWEDAAIDVEPSVLLIRHQATDGWPAENPEWDRPLDPPKSGTRSQLMHPSVIAALRHQREQLRRLGWYRLDGPIFPGRGGRWRTHADTIKPEVFRALAVSAGLPNAERWTTHSLRHSFATLEVIASGGDLRGTQKRTGHSSLQQLETYMHRAGRGLPSSSIPALGDHLVPHSPAGPGAAATTVDGRPVEPVVPAGELVDLMLASTDRAVAFQEERDKARRDARRESNRQFAARQRGRRVDLSALLAATPRETVERWRASGDRPPEATGMLDDAYRKAYQRTLRATKGDMDAAREAGQRSRRAAAGNWGRLLARRLAGGS